MIFNKSGHRSLNDATQVHAFSLQSLLELRTEVVSDRAIEAHGQCLPALIQLHIAHEEAVEVFHNKVLYALVGNILCQERHERSQEAVRHLLAIHTLDDVRGFQLELLFKALTDVLGQLTLQDVAHQVLAQHGATTLIAEDEAQRRYVLHQFLAIIQARVATSAQDASNARLVAADATGSSQHIRSHLQTALYIQMTAQSLL